MTDLLERLRAVNPVPTCAAPAIEDVWRKLEHEDQAPGLDVRRARTAEPARSGPPGRALARFRFGVGRVTLAMAVAIPVVVAALALVLLSHHRGHHPVAALSPQHALPAPIQRLADGTINCFFGINDHGHGHAGPDVSGAGADGRSPIAICREWYRLNAHTGRNAADVAFVACQANATTIAVYVADGRSRQCQRVGDRPLPRAYGAAVAHLHALVQALAGDEHRHDCVSPTVLAGEVRASLARLGFLGWRLNLPSGHFDPRFDPPRGTGGTCGHVLGNPLEFDARRRTVFITAGPPTSVVRIVSHLSYDLYARTDQQCFTPTTVRVLVRRAFARTPLRPRFATVAGPAGVQFGSGQTQQRYNAGCVKFALAIPANDEHSIYVLLYAHWAPRLAQGRIYPPASGFRP